MKKMIVISILFALLLSVGAWEIVYSTGIYNDLHQKLEVLESYIAEDGEEVDTLRNISLVGEVERRWEKARQVMFCLGNHNTLRMLDEKILSLAVMIKINHFEDAKVTVRVAKQLVKSISNDTLPVITNLF